MMCDRLCDLFLSKGNGKRSMIIVISPISEYEEI